MLREGDGGFLALLATPWIDGAQGGGRVGLREEEDEERNLVKDSEALA